MKGERDKHTMKWKKTRLDQLYFFPLFRSSVHFFPVVLSLPTPPLAYQLGRSSYIY